MNPAPTTLNLILGGLVGALVITFLDVTYRHASVAALILGAVVLAALLAAMMTRWTSR